MKVCLAVWNAKSMASAGRIEDEDARNARRTRIRTIMRAATAACLLVAALFAASSLERTPITGRWRVISGEFEDDLDFYRQQTNKLLEEKKERILSDSHPVYLRAHEVVTRLLEAACSEEQLQALGVAATDHICSKAAKVKWRLAVVDERQVANACVTPDGTIIVYTGLLPLLADGTNGTSTAEWFHRQVLGLQQRAASDSSPAARRQRQRMQEADAFIQAHIKSPHQHQIMAGGVAALMEIPVSDSRMAAVLGHEISHCMLRHLQERAGDSLMGELLSVSFLSILQLPFFNSISIWATPVIEYLGFQMGQKATTLLVELPYSRLHEYEADHVGMVLMACSGYDPSHAAKLWHEFDAICKRQAAWAQFYAPYWAILAEKRAALEKKGHKSEVYRLMLQSMVKDGLLHIYNDEGSGADETYDSFVYPGYVSSFPLEPSIHPYDGVFTGRLSILLDPVGPCLCQFNDGRRLSVCWKNGVPIGPARDDMPDGSAQLCSFDDKGRKHGWCADVTTDGKIVNERFIYALGVGPLEGWMYRKSLVDGNVYVGKAPQAFYQKVEQVCRAVSAVASAGSFLPMPEHSPVEDEYLRTHPSGENREQELHAHLQECYAYRANWERLFKDRPVSAEARKRVEHGAPPPPAAPTAS